MRGYLVLVLALFGSSCFSAALPEPLVEDRGASIQPQCKRDGCLGALWGYGEQASQDCVLYRRTTVTPRASTTTCTTYKTIMDKDKTVTQTVTNYHTETATSYTTEVTEEDVTTTTTTTVATATVTEAYRNPVQKRSYPAVVPKIPEYARGPCKGAARYTSACECIHATQETTYAPRPTVTKYTTKTRWECHTITAQQTVDETVTNTAEATITSTSTSTATATASVTATTTVTPLYPGPAFTLQDMYHPDKQISVAPGAGTFNLLVGTSPATPFYLDNQVLHSYANLGQSVGFCPNPAAGNITNIFTHPVSESPCQQNSTLTPLQCQLFGNMTLGSSGSVNCTYPGFSLAACAGNLIWAGSLVNPTSNSSNGTNSSSIQGCSDRFDLNLKYTIIDPTQPPVSRRDMFFDADYSPPQRRRKSRPDPEAPVVLWERASASE